MSDHLSDALIDIARGAHDAIATWPRELERREADIAGDPSPVYAPPPDHREQPGPARDDRDPPRDSGDPAPLRVKLPFYEGERILDRRHPFTAMTVTRCEPHFRGGYTVHWKIEQGPGRSPMTGIQPCAGLILAQEDWEDCPDRPLSMIDALEYASDGPISGAARRAAYDADGADAQQAAHRAYYVARKQWAEKFLWPLSRELGNAEINNMRDLIATIDAGEPARAAAE